MEDAPTLYPAKMPDGSIVVTGLQHASEIPRNTFGAEPTHVYACVSDRPIAPEQMFYSETSGSGWEIDEEYEFSGAVHLGELTSTQYAAVAEDFPKHYKGQYVVRFDWEESFPPTDPKLKRQLAHAASAILNEDQKKVLDIVLQIANNVRDADGCGNKNVQFTKSKGEKDKKAKPIAPPLTTAAIAKVEGKKVDDKMRNFLKRHKEAETWTSPEWGRVIGETDAAVRKAEMWKKLSKKKWLLKELHQIQLRLHNEYLTEEQRDALNDKMDSLLKEVPCFT